MLETVLAYLSYYQNPLRLIPGSWWIGLSVLFAWKTLVSVNIARQTGLRSYVWGTLAGALATLGTATAPLGHNLLQLFMFSAPVLTAAFLIASVVDARSWFSDEASDKFLLIRHQSLRLQLWGQLPADFVRNPSAPATRRQGLLMSFSTLVFMVFAYLGAARASAAAQAMGGEAQANFSPRAMLIVALTVAMAMFHALMLGLFAAVYGAPTPKGRRKTPDAGRE